MNLDIFWLRSFCPKCQTTILGRDLIPVLSWIWLKGKCRHCLKKISPLYPAIELLTAILLFSLFAFLSKKFWLPYTLFLSALIVTIRSDIETMMISRFVTLYLVPVGLILSATPFLPITLTNSILGATLGYGFLFAVSKLFFLITKRDGIGHGDMELLAFIGAFLGVTGFWLSLLVGSIVGSIFGIIYLLAQGKSIKTKIPFGPFLSFGAIVSLFFGQQLSQLLLGL